MRIINLSWKKTDQLVSRLKKKLDKRYDLIIGINRGGLVPSVMLSHAAKVKHGVITIESYKGNKKGKHVVDWHVSRVDVLLPLATVLLVDDISDSGGSLIKTIKVLQELGCKKSKIDTATLHYKKKSKFKPTYFAEQVKDADWINYPWEK